MIDVLKIYYDGYDCLITGKQAHEKALNAVAAAVYEDAAKICDELMVYDEDDPGGSCAKAIRSAAGGRERK